MAETDQALKDNEALLKELNDYIDGSELMKITEGNAYASEAIYTVNPAEGVDFNAVISAYWLYVTDGAILEECSANGIDKSYLRELISWSNSANTFSVTVIASDEAFSAQLLSACDAAVTAKVSEFSGAYGGFDLIKSDESHFIKYDGEIFNTQESVLNRRRDYLSANADLERRVSEAKAALDQFKEESAPETEIRGASPVKAFVKYGIFGGVFGVIIVFGVSFLAYFFGRRLKSTKDLVSIDMDVLALYSSKKGIEPDKDDLTLSVRTYCDMSEKDKMGFLRVSDTERAGKAVSEVAKVIKDAKCGITPVEADYFGNRAEMLKSLDAAGQVVLILEKGRSFYADIENAVRLCERFGITVRGCVVIQ